MRYAEEIAQSRSAKEIVLHTSEDNQAARKFYAAMGYEEWELVLGRELNECLRQFFGCDNACVQNTASSAYSACGLFLSDARVLGCNQDPPTRRSNGPDLNTGVFTSAQRFTESDHQLELLASDRAADLHVGGFQRWR